VIEGFERSDVAVDQDAEVLVSGLGGNPVQRHHPGQCCGGGVAGAQGVSGDAGAVESGGLGAGAEHTGDDVSRQRLEGDRGGPDPREERARCLTAGDAPGVEGGDRVGEGVLSVGDGDLMAVAVAVGLGLPDMQQQAGGLVLEVGEGEPDELATPHR
jgi:hypothetical protein